MDVRTYVYQVQVLLNNTFIAIIRFHAYVGFGVISNDMATVRINNLQCEVTYTIIAGGRDVNTEELIGPRSSHGTITAGPCLAMMTTSVITTSMTDGKILD